MKITDHKLSEGIALTFRVPEGNIKHPLIILCHGFCGIRNVLLPCFANAFTEAGFATIIFDYRGFGESDGERGRLVPAMQTEDIISVINWAEKQECIDNQRIGLWGTSLGAGLSWPLPAGMSEQELDACLYGQFSTVPVVRPESTVISEAPMVKKRPRRPNFPYEFKIALVEQSLQPGACVAQIARENGINDNLLFNWRHQYRKGGLLPSGKNMPALLPVTLTPEPDNKIPAPAQEPEQINTPSDSLCCELVLPAGTLRLKGKLTPALLQTLIREIKGSSH
ncbi:IS66-like element accessory protein TnpA [Escherichia coli]|nr:IS66-like element accessory protein TnpA [Escherichia coli]MDD9005303.1 IS66-like element accessory protein TnpA [Escherichia coli]MDD9018560.1 IS66-like element accessory protein TnpA [Escherichia coli]MDD9031904.1 IS66-like element accessory protein TnpA [Escherichia coli]